MILVVQGRARSGALLTAREGLRLGRPVAAIPWDCREPLGEARHALIRDGRATLVRDAGDVIDLLGLPEEAARRAPASGGERRPGSGAPPRERGYAAAAGPVLGTLDPGESALWAALRHHPQPLDQAAERAGLTAAAASAALVTLELRGLAVSGPGGFVQRARRGR